MAYTYYRSVTLSEALSGTADSTNFVATFTGTYAYLATVANGGKVENANGYDIAFFSDSGLTTALDFELVQYTATTGFIEAHVRIPTLSTSADTVIYVAYGDSGISTFQGDVAGTWSSDFDYVAHGGDGTTVSVADSTSNAVSTTNNGVAAVAGKVGGAMDFVRASSDNVALGSTGAGALTTNRPLSLSGWIYRNSTGNTQAIWGGTGGGGTNGYFLLRISSEKLNLLRSQEANIASSTTNVPSGSWVHFGVTYNTSNGYVFYLNGAADGSGTAGTGFNTGTSKAASLGQDSGSDYLNAYLDEIRKCNVIRSASWFTAEYNNQSSPSTFYTIGSEVGGSAPTGTGSGSFAVAGSGTATVAIAATGTGAVTVAGSGTARVAVAATGTGSFTVAGSGTGTVAVTATGSGSFTVAGSGTAVVGDPPVDANGSGGFTVTGSGTGTIAITASGSGGFTVSGSGEAIAGFTPAIATGSGGFTVAGSGTATVPVTATGSGSATVSGSGTATIPVTATGSGGFTVSGSGEAISGFTPAIASGAGGFTVSGSATATVLVQGNAVGIFVVGGSGLATIPVLAVGAGSFVVAGSGTALATFGIPPSTALRITSRSAARYVITPRPRA